MTSQPFCLRAGEGGCWIACRVQEGLAVLETAAEGKAVKGRVAVGAQVADGPVLVSPGAGQAGAGRAGRGAAAGRVHGVAGLALTWRPGRPLGLQSGPGPRELFLKMYVRQVSLGGRTELLWLASCLYLFGLCVGQAVVASYSVHAVHGTTVSLVASYMYSGT
jgi:hypothetical protein